MSGGKWIPNLKRTTRIAAAARHVLSLRLQAVRDAVPPAVQDAGKDPEHVHRLRVATRRAHAALEVFAPCLPPGELRAASKRVRKVRRAAGAARDWDVFLADLERSLPGSRRADRGRDFLVGYALARRAEAQHQLEEVGQKFPFAWDRLVAETVASVHPPRLPGCVVLADLAAPQLSGPLHSLSQAAHVDTDDFERLHQVRIVGKRLRYALEIFGDCLAEPIRDRLYAAIEEMQSILGNANDSFVACRRLEELRSALETLRPRGAGPFRTRLDTLLRDCQDRLPRQRQRFQEWCAAWKQAGSGAAFLAALRGSAAAG